MQHLYECLKRDIDYNPNQVQQFTQIQELELPEFLYLQEDLLGTKVKKVLLIRSISEFLNPVPQEMSQHQNCKRCPSTSLYELNSLSSSLLLSWSVLGLHMCIVVFDVLLIVLCFVIVYLLSWARSLGRCF